ncbi:MAG: tRNA threonylcarbamoyladenosine dehydratase [Spirochaetia bacterium]|nr:tRNA threonylcarbamoyladenosine dehydratase [Spirochaetia bacterium]
MERFSRIIQLLGQEQWDRISRSKVAVFGLGAVGGWASEILARSGVSHFILTDFDRIAKTNINRHVCALESTVGIPKVEALKARILDINPKAEVITFQTFADRTNFADIITEGTDVIIDAIDSLGPKIELLEYTSRNNLPVISSMGAALKTDPSAIRTGYLFETEICPLARALRKHLRRRGIESGIPCVYSVESPDNNALIAPDEDNDDSSLKRGRPRNILGSYPAVTAIFGITLADMAIKMILGGTDNQK